MPDVHGHRRRRASDRSPRGRRRRELFADDRSVVVARVDGVLVDLATELADGDEVEARPVDSPGRPLGAAALHRARAGPGGAGAVPAGAARHRAADRERLLLRLRRRARRSPRGPRARSRSGCRRSSRRASGSPAGSSPTTRRRAELADEPYKLELIGLKGGGAAATRPSRSEVGGGELTIYDNLDAQDRRARLERPVPRPAPADHPAHPGVQADAHRPPRTGAGTRRTRSCSASTAPRGSRADALKAHLAMLEEAEKRDHRRLGAELDLFSLPGRDRLRAGGLPPQGRRRSGARWRTTSAAPARGGRLRVRRHPAHHQGGAVRDLRAPALVRGRHVPADGARRGVDDDGTSRRPVLPQADELPDAQPDLPSRAGGPTASCRCGCSSSARVYRYEKSGVVHGLTRVRGMTQDDAHILLRPRSRCPARSTPAELRARPAARLRARRLLPRAVDQRRPGRSSSAPTRSGTRRPRRCARRPRESGPRARPRPGRRRVLRAEDLRPGPGRDRPHLADVDHPGTTSTSRERFELEYQAADGTRQQPVMIHRRCSARSSGSSAC